MSSVTLLGFAAAACTTIAFLPQVIKTWRTQSTHDISLATLLLLVVGVALWLIYGVLMRDPPLVIANAITLALAGMVLILKLKHR